MRSKTVDLRIVILVLAFGSIVAFGMRGVFAQSTLPASAVARSATSRCRETLRELRDGHLSRFESEHKRLPYSLAELREAYAKMPEQPYVCPVSGKGYAYVAGWPKLHIDGLRVLIAFDAKGNHPEGRCVLRMGPGSPALVTEEVFQAELAQTREIARSLGLKISVIEP